jgi:predicted acetyltransferase
MMRAQLDDVHERGEPLAMLWASEATIYERFGYGIASWAGEITVPRVWGAFAHPFERRGVARLIELEEAEKLFPRVYEAARAVRPGMHSRTEEWWRLRTLRTRDEEKSNPKRFVVIEVDGAPVAYAIWRRQPAFEAGVTVAQLEVLEAIGAEPWALAEIWRFLLDFDWTETIQSWLVPPDHPLFLLLANPRRARYRMGDGVWLRVVDVGAALGSRSYRSDAAVVLELRDAFCPWNEGRWKVEAGRAERTEEPADIALTASALGSVYLGCVSFAELRAALRIEELRDGAVMRADEVFGWHLQPWNVEIF